MIENKSTYTKYDFSREVFSTDIVDLIEVLKYKKNIILQGAPGVGKTYMAKKLAYAFMGVIDDSRVEYIQFHQSYSYEDFVVGIKLGDGNKFIIEHGIFYQLCKRADADTSKKPYFIIIDEINRANVARVFGECISIIDKDLRDTKIKLKYNGEYLSVPSNLYIIGTMNTADRGIAIIDYAFRRRFSFINIEPAYRSQGFRRILQEANSIKFNKIARKMIELNNEICEDSLLGKGFQIGHSYFCVGKAIDDSRLKMIIEYEIMPLIEEYWYDDRDKVESWRAKFMAILNSED